MATFTQAEAQTLKEQFAAVETAYEAVKQTLESAAAGNTESPFAFAQQVRNLSVAMATWVPVGEFLAGT